MDEVMNETIPNCFREMFQKAHDFPTFLDLGIEGDSRRAEYKRTSREIGFMLIADNSGLSL